MPKSIPGHIGVGPSEVPEISDEEKAGHNVINKIWRDEDWWMTQEPLNHKGPTTAEVMERLAKFLSTPVKNETGGWTDVTREDWFELSAIFGDILDAKFERDQDGDHTIEYDTCHRQQGRMQVVRIPYNMDTPAEREKAMHAIRMASGIIEQVTRTLQCKFSDERRLDARLKKMKPVLDFLVNIGARHAHKRVHDYLHGESLFIGRDDTVWSPMGLSCAELRQIVSDNMGNPCLYDKLDDTLLTATKAMGGSDAEHT